MSVSRVLAAAAVLGLGLAVLRADPPPGKAAESGLDCTLYTKPYKATEHGAFALPEGLKWQVRPRYVGRTEAGERVVDDRLTLVLADDKNSFWPVIAKMSVEEAEQLQRDLAKVIAQKKADQKPGK